jgi:hypothetical protein
LRGTFFFFFVVPPAPVLELTDALMPLAPPPLFSVDDLPAVEDLRSALALLLLAGDLGGNAEEELPTLDAVFAFNPPVDGFFADADAEAAAACHDAAALLLAGLAFALLVVAFVVVVVELAFFAARLERDIVSAYLTSRVFF